MTREVAVGNAVFGGDRPLVLIAGPCVIEEEALTLRIAEFLKRLTAELGIGLVFKASYDKANRTSVTSFRGPGMAEGLRILARVKARIRPAGRLRCPRSLPGGAGRRGSRHPADPRLSLRGRPTCWWPRRPRPARRSTSRRGSFWPPGTWGTRSASSTAAGNRQILLTERGASFGYNNLVVDMRSLVIMRETGCPVDFRRHPLGSASRRRRHRLGGPAPVRRRAVAGGGRHRHRRPVLGGSRRPGTGPVRRAQLPLPRDLREMLEEVLAIDAVVKK